MRLLVTGGSGVLGRALLPLAEADGHQVRAPGHAELDLFDPAAVAAAMRGADAVLHLATRIQPLDKMDQFGMWSENDRLRAEASVILVDAALAAGAKTYIQPTVTEDAGRALLAALTLPSGIYNVCRDGERVSNQRFTEATGWRPLR